MHIYLRVTDDCNLNCKHCYSLRGENYMPLDVVKKIAKKFGREHFIFHGGEPTLLSPEWYSQVFEILKEGTFSIQSNLFNIDKNWLGFLDNNRDKFRNRIGTSLDFYRIKHIDSILDNVSKLSKLGFEISAIVTVGSDYSYDDYYLLIQEFLIAGGKDFKVQLISPLNGNGNLNINKMKSIFLELLNLKKNTLRDNLNLCSLDIPVKLFGGNCARGVRTVNPDGKLYVCPEFAGQNIFSIGDVDNGITSQENLKMFYLRVSHLIYSCDQDCFRYCEGGCTALAYFSNKLFEKDLYCEIYKESLHSRINLKTP